MRCKDSIVPKTSESGWVGVKPLFSCRGRKSSRQPEADCSLPKPGRTSCKVDTTSFPQPTTIDGWREKIKANYDWTHRDV
jgi:hypothetical protein